MKFLPEGVDKDNIMLCNMIYNHGNKDHRDSLDIVYKEIDSGEKILHTIDEPQIEIFFTNPEHRNYEHNKPYIEMSKTTPVLTTIRNIPFVIAKDAGPSAERFLRDCIDRREFRKMEEVNKYYYVFGSDIDAETYYRTQWLLNYDNEVDKMVTKMFLDIEVDSIDVPGFPRDGECPINAVSVVDNASKTVFTFLLENDKNPQIQEFKDSIDSFIEELHEAFDESYGVLNYKIYMYDDEKKLIRNVFKLVNTLKRDFLLIWNMGFDIPYIIARCEKLGLNPEDIICHPDFKYPKCRYVKDTRNFQIANKGDKFECSSYTKYVDQMILYAATRKGRKELRSNTLNNIAREELGDAKLDYSDEADIKTLPYVNYRKFVMYNIKDTLLQSGIENKVCDIDDLYLSSYLNCCNYDKVFKQTFILKRRAYYEYILQGNILGNNVNVFNEAEEGGYSGAVVGDPLLNSETGIPLFNGYSKYVYDNVIDMDFSSMYPNIVVAFNIERNTMIGKLVIPEVRQTYDHLFDPKADDMYTEIRKYVEDEDSDEEEVVDTKYDAGSDFMDDWHTGDTLSIGSKWFNLPSYDKLADKFRKKFGIRDRETIHVTDVYIATEPLYINIGGNEE